MLGTTYRFAYGIPWLEAGIPMVVTTLGIFSIPQVIDMLEEGGTVAKCVVAKDSIFKGFIAPLRRPLTMLRAAGVGAFVGILPALGVPFAGIVAYLTEKKYSKEAPQFGKGAPAGLVAAEMGKGSCVIGDLIPTFTLGIPGSVTGAIIMAALIIQGVEPGPRFLLSGKLPYTIFAGLLLAQATFLITGLLVGKQLGRIAYIPNVLLSPLLTVLVFLGAYATQNSGFDMFVALAFGLFAYALVKIGYPVVCMVLGIILGPLIEANFHRALGESMGSYSIFVTRPITVIMLAITVLFVAGPYLLYLSRRFRKQPPTLLEESLESEAKKGESKAELIVLLFVGVIFSAFLYTGRNYSPLVRLFPCVVCSAGLGFVVWRLLVIIFHVPAEGWRSAPPTPATPFRFFEGRISWQWSMATMLAYMLLIYVLGFVISSALYIAGIFVLTGGRHKWGRAILSGIVVGLGIFVMAKLVHLLLPVGILTGV